MGGGYTIGIAGSGGDGVILLGELLARTAASAGLHCYLTKNFGPQIRGGESSCRLTLAAAPVHCPSDRLDLLAVLDWPGLRQFEDELRCTGQTRVLADERDLVETALLREIGAGGMVQQLPLEEFALVVAGSKQARNLVLAGALLKALGWPPPLFLDQLTFRLAKYGPEELERMRQAVNAGYALEQAEADLATAQPPDLPEAETPSLELLTGNEAVVRGALAGGCRFMAGYPISPATEILENLMRLLPRLGGNCVQAEDEIAAAGLALGAAYGGAAALTATSGPGLSLKVETLGLAVMAELPLVVVDVQRCGPSTGIPTRTEQADLNLALYGRHGDAPLPVLAPVSIQDCAVVTEAAFMIAQHCRTPVLVLSDQYLGQGVATAGPAADGEVREDATAPPSVSSGMAINLTGLEHTADGAPTSDPGLHDAACARRAAKLEALLHDQARYPAAACYAPRSGLADNSGPRLGILTWGSSYGPACAAADELSERGVVPSVFAPRLVYPLALDELTRWLAGQEHLLLVELNHSGQFHRYLRTRLDLPRSTGLHCRAGGAPFSPEELLVAAARLLAR